jgi:hypothetical protein
VFPDQLNRTLGESLAEFYIAILGVVQAFLAVEIIGINPGAQRFIGSYLLLSRTNGVPAGVVFQVIAKAANDDGNVFAFGLLKLFARLCDLGERFPVMPGSSGRFVSVVEISHHSDSYLAASFIAK